ncbi:DUF2637 domain-containing protein [Phytohabitans kaempferiae]|uniref:DUF2637 domain-containing protein n=1 Tax=Phytohabitans kaempferiae TaxID=1620943 RepID=A0ABV6MA21_9ACTN
MTEHNSHPHPPQLLWIRWAVRTALALGVAASVAANVLHAHPSPISQAIAAWPPVALLLTVELIARVPVHRRLLAAARVLAAAAIAVIAAYVSYWHMVEVVAEYGETGAVPYLLPLSVDGLIVVASVSLVEITGRIRSAGHDITTRGITAAHPAAGQDGRAPLSHVPASHLAGTPTTPGGTIDRQTPPASAEPSGGQRPRMNVDSTRGGLHDPNGAPDDGEAGRDQGGQVPEETAQAVAFWLALDPTLRPADVAKRIGRTPRTVRRHWPDTAASRSTGTTPASAKETGTPVRDAQALPTSEVA